MVFTSTVFLFIFLPMVLAIYYTVLKKHRVLQNVFLCVCSIFFYAWGAIEAVPLLCASIVFNWIFAILIEKNQDKKGISKTILIISLCYNISTLFVYKYLTFTLENMKNLFGFNIGIPQIALPIGISFFTFHAISYTMDIYRRKATAQRNTLNVGLYITFFPQLIAGPIVRYSTIADQINNRVETLDAFSEGVRRFIIGFLKKVLIANSMAIIATAAFSQTFSDLSFSFAWLGAIAYTFQIYYDFSGYSDMAIGLAKMFGFHFQENFEYPYSATSITKFWRKWHISLSSWFRDYVYYPLGGSRVETKLRLIFNLFIVWTLTGIWHGANFTFIFWGLMYFVLLVFEKITKFGEILNKHKVFGWFYTIFFVIISWVFFRAESLEAAAAYLSAMFGLNQCFNNAQTFVYLSENVVFLISAAIFILPIKNVFGLDNSKYSSKLSIIGSIVLVFLFIVSIFYIINNSYNPFIYFNF